ncbi:phosphotransferase [Heyndrickxia sp. NPDC080065]|uniref:phosphotransferase n=1 Tax=Heyndrickxia sp. NPDC080065 TaxID=3390568 RepID=UPI003D05BD69
MNRSRFGDGLEDRLLLYLSAFTGEVFKSVKKIKTGIWICFTSEREWILKEFSSITKMNNQISFIDHLFKYGFHFTYKFHPIHREKIFFFENKIFGLIEYIKKEYSFTYQTSQERNEALILLDHFHKTTAMFLNEFESKLQIFDQIRKWEIRLNEFIVNIPLVKKFIQPYYIEVYLEWAKWSFANMKKHQAYFNKKPNCIIHGDVAHHNFLIGKNQQLYIIDFDLIHLALPNIDYLQFSNRILPNISWSCNELYRYEILKEYLKDKPFLFALVFPTDILREWNRYIKWINNSKDDGYLKYLDKITIKQFKQRQTFVNEVIKRI